MGREANRLQSVFQVAAPDTDLGCEQRCTNNCILPRIT